MAQNPSSDDSDYPSAPPAPPAVYQDKPPSYDEAISGKAPAPDAVGFTYPNQPGLQNKGEYCPSVPQYGPGPPPAYASGYTQGQHVLLQEGDGYHQGISSATMPSMNEVEFKKHPEKVTCSNCSFYDYTRVEDKINSEGWLWCILCCCCGIWLLSFLVKCMDGFREFHHYCARCGKKLATYRPKFSSGSIILLIILAFLAVTLIGFACYFRMNGGRRMH